MYNEVGNIRLSSSIGEASPVSELNIGSYKLTQGYFQYQLKNISQIIQDKEILLSVFPNPFIDQIHVDLMESGYGDIEFNIEDPLGHNVYYYKISRIRGNGDDILLHPVSLAVGTYILTINYLEATNKKILIKLIKQ